MGKGQAVRQNGRRHDFSSSNRTCTTSPVHAHRGRAQAAWEALMQCQLLLLIKHQQEVRPHAGCFSGMTLCFGWNYVPPKCMLNPNPAIYEYDFIWRYLQMDSSYDEVFRVYPHSI